MTSRAVVILATSVASTSWIADGLAPRLVYPSEEEGLMVAFEAGKDITLDRIDVDVDVCPHGAHLSPLSGHPTNT